MNFANNRYPTLTVEIIQKSHRHVGGGVLALVANESSGLVSFEKPPTFQIVEHGLAHLFGDVKLSREILDAPRSQRIAPQQEQRLQLGHRLDLLSDKVANVIWQRVVQGFFVGTFSSLRPMAEHHARAHR